ncbi:MAG TPA: DHA2 family efflux MFS transporter permease subunit [Verrucomicrobiae bacterium]|nr:DHA2 family efflux MFS transporter permease subunit [Verrucomicrobiae bacterium]
MAVAARSAAGSHLGHTPLDESPAASRMRALITITVMLGLIMAIIDSTIVNVALPTIGGNLGASITEYSWVATGYILATVVVMPLNGWLTARFGRKRFYAASLALFTIASLMCGTAHSISVLVVYRVIQGIGGGALQPTAQAILFETYPPAKRGVAMAIFGMGAMVGPAVGPVLGGYLVDNATWPVIFFINIPIGIVAFLMTMAYIPNPSFITRSKGAIDFVGLGLLTAGLASLQYVLEQGQQDDWWSSSTIVLLTVVATVSLAVFLWKTLRDKQPLVDVRVFRFPSFTFGSILGTIMGVGLFGSAFILPLFFQNIIGFTATTTGLLLLPGALATALSMLIAGQLIGKIDPRIIIAAGMLLFAASSWAMGDLTAQSGFWDVFWPRAWQGLSFGLLFVPLSTVTLGAVPISELAGATGVNTLLRQLGGSFGIAILTTLLARQTAVAWNVLASGVTQSHGYDIGTLTGMVAQQSAVIGFNYLFQICAIVFVVSAPLVFFLKAVKHAPGAAAMAE